MCAKYDVEMPAPVVWAVADDPDDQNSLWVGAASNSASNDLVLADAASCIEVQSDSEGAQPEAQDVPASEAAQQMSVVDIQSAGRQAGVQGVDSRPTVAELQQLSRQELEQLCVRQADVIASSALRIRSTQAKLVQQRCKANAASRQASRSLKLAEKIKMNAGDPFSVMKKGKQKDGRGGRLSTQAIFSIGIRRCLTTISAADFGIVAMFDVSGQTVIRCEQRTAAAIQFCMRSHVAEGLDVAYQCSQGLPDAFSLMAIGCRADATNSSVWRRSKLHVLEAGVLYIQDFTALKAGDFNAAANYRRCVFLDFGLFAIF